ncbi:RNase H domain-containing protein [Abeliophyllum distichum]|uniref:RNase H domain-containing protein n=1 Tax=Abeliophyllum distichum TaxID=126358 RepID=A0ABD1U442_9LAMI
MWASRMSRVKFGAFGIWGLQLLHVLIIPNSFTLELRISDCPRRCILPQSMLLARRQGAVIYGWDFTRFLLQWMVGRDFNVIAHNGERTGRNTRDRVVFPDSSYGNDCSWEKIFRLKQGRRWWNRHVFGDIFQRVRDAECRVDEAESIYDSDPTPAHRDTLHQAQAGLNQTLSTEEAFWKQKAGARWELLSAAPQPVHPIRPDIIPRLVSDEDNLQLNQTQTLAELISAPQSGFILGRLIGDNILLVQELLHTLDTKVRVGNVILKLDMAKAYDRLDWGFLIYVLKGFGFDAIWIDRIRKCISECFRHQQQPLTYLGVLLFKGPRKIFLYDDLVQKVRSRISGWASRLLSPRGRIILIRSVLSSLPLYLLQIMKPPKAVLKKLESIFDCSQSLWAQFLLSKYCQGTHLILATVPYSASVVWRRLKHFGLQAESHIAWKLGRGHIFFWHDCWKGDSPLANQLPQMTHSSTRVRDLFDDIGWNIDSLLQLVPQAITEEIRNIPTTV